MFPFLGSLISGGLGLLGGMFGSDATKDANAAAAASAAAANKQQMKIARMNIALQKQFARTGIQWKVKDARRAGISPLYALGANTISYSPVSAGYSTVSPAADTSMANALASVGQDVGRAVTTVMTQSERQYQDTVRALDLQRMGLSNELLKSQIARERTLSMPTMPNPVAPPDQSSLWNAPIVGGRSSPITPLQFGGLRWETDPNTSNAQDVENRYGDEGPIAWAAGVPAMLSDLYRNSLLGRYSYGLYPFNK
ncbi:MAG: DNA pilot protein [Microviridae sp.]|nr:MAG: DNA pilot protein [Microviridae sp.]